MRFRSDFNAFRRLAAGAGARLPMAWADRYPCLTDATAETGFDRHYILHPAWAARVLARLAPPFHVDISSSLHFCTLVSAFVPVRFFDYRPARMTLPGLSSAHADLTRLPFADGELPSLSCMHVVEHVGLGRYGDAVDADGDLKAIAELKRVVRPGGSLLFVVPVGRPRIQFNAHRIYGYDQIVGCFDGFRLMEYALIPDRPEDGDLIVGATAEQTAAQSFGCGCFWFVREG